MAVFLLTEGGFFVSMVISQDVYVLTANNLKTLTKNNNQLNSGVENRIVIKRDE